MIFIILTVQVVEKTRDIGVLQSMGATPWGTAGVFFRIGMVLCFVGTIIGGLYGLGFAYFVNDIQRWVRAAHGDRSLPVDDLLHGRDTGPVRFGRPLLHHHPDSRHEHGGEPVARLPGRAQEAG